MGRKSRTKWERRMARVQTLLTPVLGSKKKTLEGKKEGMRLRTLFVTHPRFNA